jgi:hypothetical protein
MLLQHNRYWALITSLFYSTAVLRRASQKGWALGLGLPACCVLCVPVALGLGLHRSRPYAD